MVDVTTVLRFLLPELEPAKDYLLAADEGGLTIVEWLRPDVPQPSADELAQAEASVDYQTWLLERRKRDRMAEIDAKTNALIGRGFDYKGPDGVTRRFSLSPEAQLNWIGLLTSKDSLTYPVEVSLLDGGVYAITSPAEVVAFYGTGIQAVKKQLDLGRGKRQEVIDAPDLAAVDAVADERT